MDIQKKLEGMKLKFNVMQGVLNEYRIQLDELKVEVVNHKPPTKRQINNAKKYQMNYEFYLKKEE